MLIHSDIVVHWFFLFLENLCDLNIAYEFSLKWFKNLLINTFERMEKSERCDKRLNTLLKLFFHQFYSTVMYSLAETVTHNLKFMPTLLLKK